MKKVNHLIIRNFFETKLKEIDLPNDVINTTIDCLLEASLFGIDSHGVNLFEHYYNCLLNGRIRKGSNIDFEIKGASIKCNANNNFANYAASKLLRELNKLSDDNGIAYGTISNSDHIGAVGIHAVNSKIKNKIILGFTNADALAVTPDAENILFGTNPISLVMDIDNQLTYIDLATTKFSMNKVKNFRRANKDLPKDVARDESLNSTTNPFKASYLEPIGAHKGFALAFMVEILTSGLAKQDHSIDLMPMYGTDLEKKRGVSHSFIVINPIFLGKDIFYSLKSTINKTIKKVSGKQSLLIPGVKELLTKNKRLEEGIPIDNQIIKVWEDLGLRYD